MTGIGAAVISGTATHVGNERWEDEPGGFVKISKLSTLMPIAALGIGGSAVFAGAYMQMRGAALGPALLGAGGGLVFGSLVGQIAGGMSSLIKD